MTGEEIDEKNIFNTARRIDFPEARAEYLQQACGADPKRIERIETLLRGYEEQASFLESPAAEWEDRATLAPLTEQPGTVIGPYKLLQQIGEGGFGIVFMAEQTAPVRRKVALKIIKPGMDTRQVIARFEAERQALALMDHPNIARVFDAGATESRRPYFVMELVHGVPITEYCNLQKLTSAERLRLFADVCRAVQHAHQKGIIHRDLKPSNVMVTLHDDKPVAKIIDFGVAKAISYQLTEMTLFTGYGQMIGTPMYMSPEQAQLSGLDLDTRSDVYSLGVLLYELVTGTTPFDEATLKRAGFDELRRILREDEPPSPSARVGTLKNDFLSTVADQRKVDPRKLSESLLGEVDWIVMKCLEKDRNRRYESANSLAADIDRYLNDEPVQACPPSATYRLRKFTRRHKAVFVAGAAVAFAAMVALGSLIGSVLILSASNEQVGREQRQTAEALKRERDSSYVQRIALAERELAAGNVGRAEELLDECPPSQRGWEWQLLKRQRYGNPPPIEHAATVVRSTFSPDGQRLATAAIDGALSIRDSRTGRIVHGLEPPTVLIGAALPLSLVYSLDGHYLAAARNDGKIRIWDSGSGQLLHSLEAHEGPAWQIAFSPNSQILASGGSDRTARLWDLTSGQTLQVFSSHPAAVKGVAFRPDGQSVVAACDDGTVKVWNRESGRETYSFHSELLMYPWSATFTPDSRRLAWSSLDGSFKVWDTTTGQLQIDKQINTNQCRGLAFSPDGTRIAAAGFDGTVRILDAVTAREMLTIFAHNSPVTGATFSPDGYRLASSSYDHTVRMWDATPLTSDPLAPHCVTLTGHKDKVADVAFSPDGRWLASASWDHTIKLWEVGNSGNWGESTPAVPVTSLGHDAITLHRTLCGHRGIVRGVAFSSDNRTLASVGWDNSLKLWNLREPTVDSFAELRSIPFPERLNSVAFSPDGKFVAVGQERGITLLDVATGKLAGPFKPTPAAVPGMVFHPNRPLLISTGASDPAIKVWSVDADKPSFEIRHNFHPNPSVAVSPDGRRLVSPGRDQAGEHTVKIWNVDWDARNYTEYRTLRGHLGYAWKVALSPDGRYLASGSWDSTVRVWDLQAPESAEPVTLRGHAGIILGLAFSPNGQKLASGSGYAGHGEIKVWDSALWHSVGDERSVVTNTPPK